MNPHYFNNQKHFGVIGDKALRYYLQNKPHIDLAKEWYDRYNLPFVFALLCYHKDKKIYKNIQKEFLKKVYKIPQYMLKKAPKKTNIDTKHILNYLQYIYIQHINTYIHTYTHT